MIGKEVGEVVEVNTPGGVKAYEILKRYYDMGMRKKGTTIMNDLPILEERLGIPPEKRCKPMADRRRRVRSTPGSGAGPSRVSC